MQASAVLQKHRGIPRVDLVPEAEPGIVQLEVHLEPLRIRVGRQPEFQYRRLVAANGATQESWAAGKHRIRRSGDTFQIASHVIRVHSGT